MPAPSTPRHCRHRRRSTVQRRRSRSWLPSVSPPAKGPCRTDRTRPLRTPGGPRPRKQPQTVIRLTISASWTTLNEDPMRRLLIRSGKVPFAAVSPEQTLARNVIGTNSGNLAFSYATHRILQTPDTELVSNGFKVLVLVVGWIVEGFGVVGGGRRGVVGVDAG